MEQIWTFIQTLCKGVIEGVKQYIDNDFQDHVTLLIFAALVVVVSLIMKIIKKKKQNKITK